MADWLPCRRGRSTVRSRNSGGYPQTHHAARPVPPTPDLKLWNGTLKKYVSTSPSIGEASLKRRIPEVRFDRVPFKQAVTALAEAAHADVIVDWGAFEAATVKDRTPISVNPARCHPRRGTTSRAGRRRRRSTRLAHQRRLRGPRPVSRQ